MKKAETPADAIARLVEGSTAKWARQRKAEERRRSASFRREERLYRVYRPETIKSAAYDAMEAAYMAASANGTLPANPRQIMYAARPKILEATEKDSLDSQYFCQTLLVDYIREFGADWDIVWDDRGHFTEPHTKTGFGLGTLKVRAYLNSYAKPSLNDAALASPSIKTHGPECRYGGVLYIEKEGFMPILERARIAEKFDIGIMSCKGMSVTAARLLIDRTCARYKIPLLILHDFDISGFSISRTLSRDTRRYQFENDFRTIDLGLRLGDVNEMDLDSEPVSITANEHKVRWTLRQGGASQEEQDSFFRVSEWN